jgi:hypothetical protein
MLLTKVTTFLPFLYLSRSQSYKTFYGRNLWIFVILFVLGKPFQLSLIILGKAWGLH